jgi:hypothetical protein
VKEFLSILLLATVPFLTLALLGLIIGALS